MPDRHHDHAQPDDAIAMFKEDHRRVRDLFQEYAAATDPRTKRELAAEACIELETHAQLEEQIFYPAVNEESDEGPELVLTLYAHSLSTAFAMLFVVSLLGHAASGTRQYNAEQRVHGQAPVSMRQYLGTARFWFESFRIGRANF